MIERRHVSLGLLAGGRASRLGGVDKAWLEYRGQALVQRALAALGDGYVSCRASSSRDPDRYAAIGLPAIGDLRGNFPGPLAGIEALLSVCESPWLLTAPVDLRDWPGDLANALCAAAGNSGAVIADAEGLQPLCALWPVTSALPEVRAELDGGAGAVHRVVTRLGLKVHDISPWRLGNLNTPEDFDSP